MQPISRSVHALSRRSVLHTRNVSTMTQNMKDDAKYIVGTYARQPFEFVRGRGSILEDVNGKKYVDFYSGIAVNALGHSHPEWVKAVQQQAGELCHIANLFYSVPQVQLAKTLCETSGMDKVFMANSGTEANEGALKFARKYAYVHTNQANPSAKKHEFVAFNGGFHGRTMGALSLTYKAAYRAPYLPMVDGVTFVDYNDTEAAMKAITDKTCAVIIEPIQGEGGVHCARLDFLRALRKRCDEVGALLIADEVQVGLGRVGELFCSKRFPGFDPDIITLAKPLAGGLPIGTILMKQKVADVMKPGDHGTTFAGGPLICTAALATLKVINQPAFLADVKRKGALLVNRLKKIADELALNKSADSIQVVDIRSAGYDFKTNSGQGEGLIVGFEINAPVKDIIKQAADRGVVFINAGEQTLRLVPPLVIEDAQINQACDIIQEILKSTTVSALKQA